MQHVGILCALFELQVFTSYDMFNLLIKHSFPSYLFERLFSLGVLLELCAALSSLGSTARPQAFETHHGMCCFAGVFQSDGWTRSAVSLPLQAHYRAVCSQPLRSLQSNREAATSD